MIHFISYFFQLFYLFHRSLQVSRCHFLFFFLNNIFEIYEKSQPLSNNAPEVLR